MKHYFHFMFAGVLLLGSLILFNNQKSECNTQLSENDGMEHMELLAEVCSNQITASSVPSIRHNSGEVNKSISGKFKHLENLYFAEHQVRMKTQMQIHLELKPVIGFQTGPYLYHRSSYDDPLAS